MRQKSLAIYAVFWYFAGKMRKRLLFITECPFFAGCENVLVNLANSPAISKNYALSVCYAYNPAYAKDARREFANINRIELPLITGGYTLYFGKQSNSLPARISLIFKKIFFRIILTTGAAFFWNFCFLAILLILKKPDIVHINNGGFPGALGSRIAAIAARLLTKAKIIMTVNNMAITHDLFWSKAHDCIIGRCIDQFVTASKLAAQSLQLNRPALKAENIESIPNCLKTPKPLQSRDSLLEAHKVPKNALVFCEVALLTERKGQSLLIQAFANLMRQDPITHANSYLILVGSGEDLPRLKRLCEESGVSDRVIFTGNQSDYASYIACCDVFVLPSIRNEDMPLVLLSAMELEKPIISSYVGGIPEMLSHEKSALLIPPGDVQALTQHMNSLSKDVHFSRQLAQAARSNYLTHFASEGIINKYLELYE